MEKMFNNTSGIIGVIGGIVVYFLGGFDIFLTTMVTFVVLDYITGIIKAIYLKELSSEICFKGILKKLTMFIVIAFAYSVQNTINNAIPLREITIMFFVTNEGISLLENASVLIPIPQKLKNILLQLRDKTQSTEKNKSEVE